MSKVTLLNVSKAASLKDQALKLQVRVYQVINLYQIVAMATDSDVVEPLPECAVWGAMEIAQRELQSIATAMEELQ